MKTYNKILIAIAIIALGFWTIYTLFYSTPASQPQLPDIQNPVSPNTTLEEPEATPVPQPLAPQASKPVSNPVKPVANSPQTLTYKGIYHPFEFSYPAGLIPVKNPRVSTQELETKSFSFTTLALNGGISGYFSFYVENGDDSKYTELIKTNPEKYNIIDIGGMKFYKSAGLENNSSNGYRIEYTTFKNDTKYRFSLIITNGDKVVLDKTSYQVESDMMENIIKSLKIN